MEKKLEIPDEGTNPKKNIIIITGATLFIILVVALSIYSYKKYQQAVFSSQTTASEKEVKELIEKVGKLIILPSDETPTVATVSDKQSLPDQPFYKKAKNGNKVLIYYKSQKAILFDPHENRIVEVARVLEPTPSLNKQSHLILSIYNGTNISGLAGRAKTNIESNNQDFRVTSIGNASRNSYEKTLLIVLNADKKNSTQELAREINASISALPVQEQPPQASDSGQIIDALIILGRDYSISNP